MKKILIILLTLLLLVSTSFAGTKVLKFEWNQEISDGFAGWKLYVSETSQSYGSPFMIIPFDIEQTSYTTSEEISSPDGETHTYYFVLTAFDGEGNESTWSNEVSAKIDFESPSGPYNLTVIIEIQ